MFTSRKIQVEKPKRIEAEQPKKEREIKIHVENVPKRKEFPDYNLLDKDFGKLRMNDFGFQLREDDFFKKKLDQIGNDNNFGKPVMRNPGPRVTPGKLDVKIDGRNRRHSDIDMIPAGRNVHDIQTPADQHATHDG